MCITCMQYLKVFFFHLFSSLSIFPKVFTSLGNGTFQISIKVSVLSKLSFRHFRQSKACLCPSFPLLCPSIFLNGKGFSDSEKYTFFENNSFILWLCLFFNTLMTQGTRCCQVLYKCRIQTCDFGWPWVGGIFGWGRDMVRILPVFISGQHHLQFPPIASFLSILQSSNTKPVKR